MVLDGGQDPVLARADPRQLVGVAVGDQPECALNPALWQYGLFRPSGPLWALFLCAPLVPLLDRLWPGRRHVWGAPPD